MNERYAQRTNQCKAAGTPMALYPPPMTGFSNLVSARASGIPMHTPPITTPPTTIVSHSYSPSQVAAFSSAFCAAQLHSQPLSTSNLRSSTVPPCTGLVQQTLQQPAKKQAFIQNTVAAAAEKTKAPPPTTGGNNKRNDAAAFHLASPIKVENKNEEMLDSEEEIMRRENVEAALRSKPQRGRKRDNLNDEERSELTRTRNREHAKSTR
jgi:hypothetical protein